MTRCKSDTNISRLTCHLVTKGFEPQINWIGLLGLWVSHMVKPRHWAVMYLTVQYKSSVVGEPFRAVT